MNVFMTIWTFITSHWGDFVAGVSTTKLFADTADSVRKILPDHLDSKKITQDSLETSIQLLNDKSVSIEEKEWELNTRRELAKSMVHNTAIEAAYDVVRGTIVLAFLAIFMRYWTLFFTSRRKES